MDLNERLILFAGLSCFGISFFIDRFASVSDPVVSFVFIVLISGPCFWSVIKWLGVGKGLEVLLTLAVLALGVEVIAVSTGFPYGAFFYSDGLGFKVFGLVPVSVAFAYPSILLGAISLGSRLRGDWWGFTVVSTALNLIADLVVDPAMISLGYWKYTESGGYYGVPLSNFYGWVVTGFLYANIFYFAAYPKKASAPKEMSDSLFLILCVWSGLLLLRGINLPGVIGAVYIAVILFFKRRD